MRHAGGADQRESAARRAEIPIDHGETQSSTKTRALRGVATTVSPSRKAQVAELLRRELRLDDGSGARIVWIRFHRFEFQPRDRADHDGAAQGRDDAGRRPARSARRRGRAAAHRPAPCRRARCAMLGRIDANALDMHLALVRAAVEQVHVAEEAVDEGRWPGGRRPPPACRPARSGRLFISTTRSATSSASSWSCVTKMLVTCSSSCRRRSQRRSSLRTLASSAPNGSSSSSTLGSTASARASAMRWRWPPESCERIAVGQPVELHQLEQVVHLGLDLRLARALAARLDAQAEGDVLEHRHVAEQRVVLEHEADLALAHVHVGGVLAGEAGSLPASAVSRPAMMRSSVVLPQPEGPSSATSSPDVDVEADVVAARGSRRTAC